MIHIYFLIKIFQIINAGNFYKLGIPNSKVKAEETTLLHIIGALLFISHSRKISNQNGKFA